jgi:heme/copper-type cytochrome/quinol oxidase subunit 2
LLFLPLFFYHDIVINSQFQLFFIANQWFWEVIYNDGIFSNFSSLNFSLNTDNTFYLPIGIYLNFYLTSADVLHAFSIPSLYSMSDCVPGLLSLLPLCFPLIGVYILYCGQICGINHSNMPLYFICA